jgi:CelD/BcsL family acetyltransferase involved in cellulose biosynthesis
VTTLEAMRQPLVLPLAAVAAPRGKHGLEVEVIPASELGHILPQWRQLEAEFSPPTLAATSAWTETWWSAYGDIVNCSLFTASRQGRLVGVALLAESRSQKIGPFRIKTCHVGTGGEPDRESAVVEFNSLFVRKEDRVEFLLALWKYVQGKRSWSEFRLDGFLRQEIQELLECDPRFEISAKRTNYMDLAEIASTGGDIFSRLSSQTRRGVRRSLRIYENAQIEWSETISEAESIFADLVLLHQERWNLVGEPGVYASQRFCTFHKELLRRLVPRGRMTFLRVKCGDEVVGCSQFLIDHNGAYLYQCGHAPYSVKNSPGLLTDYLGILECQRRGYHKYDFMAGDSYHKQRLSSHAGELVWGTFKRPSWQHRLVSLGRMVKQRLGLGKRAVAKAENGNAETEDSQVSGGKTE